MKKVKAVVLERDGYRCTVLCENGSFRRIYRFHKTEAGEEIVIRAGVGGIKGGKAWVGAAVVFFMVLTTLFGWNLYQAPTAVALLSVDINPSIQFSVDGQGNLLTIDSQNGDAEEWLNQADLKGKPIEKVLEQFVSEVARQQLLDPQLPWIVVGYSPLNNDKAEKNNNENLSESQIVSCLTENAKKNGFTPQIAFFTLTSQEREHAQKGKLTLGEYALWQTAVKAGVATQEEKLSNTSERIKLLDDPKVQAQVQEDKKEEKLSTAGSQAEGPKSLPEKSKAEQVNSNQEPDKERDTTKKRNNGKWEDSKDQGKDGAKNPPKDPAPDQSKRDDWPRGGGRKDGHRGGENPEDMKQSREIDNKKGWQKIMERDQWDSQRRQRNDS